MNFITSNWLVMPDPPFCIGYVLLKDKLGKKYMLPSVGVGTDCRDSNEPINVRSGATPPPDIILGFLEDIGTISYMK
jgi:hypothetical protein